MAHSECKAVIAFGGIHQRSRLPATSQMSTNTLKTRMSQNAFPSSYFPSYCRLCETINIHPVTLIIPWTFSLSMKLIQSFCSKPFLKIPFAAVQTLSKGWIADLLN